MATFGNMQSRRRESSLSPKKLRDSFAKALEVWQANDMNNSVASRAPVPMQRGHPPPPLQQRPIMQSMQRVKSSFNLFSGLKGANEEDQQQQPSTDHDLPRAPASSPELLQRLQILNGNFAQAASQVAKAKSDISSRRSTLFETVDPILLVLQLLPQELSNVHKCVKQALMWNFLTDESKSSFEADANTICREVCFALPHLAITERNESLEPACARKIAYRATAEDWAGLQNLAMTTSPEMLKVALQKAFRLESNLQRALEGVGMCLRNLTKTRIRYKKLLYEAMDIALMTDEAQKKSGVAMNVLLHPSWN